MSQSDRDYVVGLRGLAQSLRDLGSVQAPAGLLPSVLGRVGPGDVYARLDTPIGPVFVAYGEAGVSAVARADGAADFERAFRARFGRPIRPAPGLPAALARALREQLLGGKPSSLRFDLRGVSEFERAVLRKVLEIPRGEVRPYAWVAREIGRPSAVRAVGAALGRNPAPLLIPCHRVVRNDGRLGGYVFGPEAKRAALAAEGVDVAAQEAAAQSGARYLGSDTTRIYCFPTCRQARRIADRHRVEFGSAAEAAAAGYRPCKLCRPAAAG